MGQVLVRAPGASPNSLEYSRSLGAPFVEWEALSPARCSCRISWHAQHRDAAALNPSQAARSWGMGMLCLTQS